MHHCLQVPEILHLILTLVPPIPSTAIARKHLLSCAITCRLFSEVALDIIWHTQPNLGPLLNLLSYEMRREQNLRLDSIAEWERLTSYASRIRRIEYIPQTKPGDDLREFRRIYTVVALPSPPVFPNLQHVEFPHLDFAVPCLDIFLESKNISLSLRWGDHDINSARKAGGTRYNVTKFFEIVETQAHHLQELDLGPSGDFGVGEGRNLSQVVPNMINLRGLACGSRKLSPVALQALATLPNLRKLHVPNNSTDILQATKDLSSEGIFLALEHLTIREDDLLSFATLLDYITPLPLKTLTVYLTELNHPSLLQKALHNLSRRVENLGDVDKIVFKYASRNIRTNAETSVRLPPIVHAEMLEPLLLFRNITHLNLDVPWYFSLCDDDIEAMATAWPRIRFLQIGSISGWGSPHLVTPKGLLSLVKGCPDLRHLSLAFNANLRPPDSFSRDHGVNTHLNYLWVGDSPLFPNSVSRLAVFLNHIFPKLSGIGGSWLVLNQGTFESSSQSWDNLAAMVRKHL